MALVLQGVERQVNRETHLYPIDLTIESGTFNVVVGRTRAGKTSLLRIIAGLDTPSAGSITMGGENMRRVPLRRRSVAMVYQAFINYPSLTVYDNIASPLRRQKSSKNGKHSGTYIDKRVRELAATLRIGHLLDRLPGHISGGQQQRVAIARALAKNADLLLLDEPLVNLDYKLREELRDELRGLLADGTTTVLYATSEPGEAMAFGANTIVLDEGRILQYAPALDVYHRPASIHVASVFSDPPMNILPVEVSDGVARLRDGDEVLLEKPGGHISGLADGSYRFAIRASDCSVRARRSNDASGIPISGLVELVEISGSETFIHLRHASTLIIVREDGIFPHPLGEELTIFLHPDRLLVFGDDDAGALNTSYAAASPS